MDSVVGVDLSGASRAALGRTVGARLTLGERPVLVELTPRSRSLSDDELVAWIEAIAPRVVALDAPLTLPHVVVCSEPVCEREHGNYGQRLVDRRVLERHGVGMPTAMIAAIAFRGIYLKRVLGHRGFEVIETYPRASLRVLQAKESPRRNPGAAATALSRRVDGVATTDPDELDAIAAALAAADYLKDPRPEPVEAADGVIWIAAAAPADSAE